MNFHDIPKLEATANLIKKLEALFQFDGTCVILDCYDETLDAWDEVEQALEAYKEIPQDSQLRNPFLEADGKESGTFQTGDRLEKAKKFTLQDCNAALALNDFCANLGCHFMNNTVEKAVRARKKQIEKTWAVLGAKIS